VSEAGDPALTATVRWLAVGRLPQTTSIRMLAPLLGAIAAGVGVSIVTAGAFVALFEGVGLLAPAAGWLVDRFGPRRVLRVALAGFSLTATVTGAAIGGGTFAAALFALGLCVNLYEAAMIAWVASASDYASRGAWMSRLDLAWAGGLLVGVPIVGALSLITWRLAYVAVAVVGAVAFLAIDRQLHDPHHQHDRHDEGRHGQRSHHRERAPRNWSALRGGVPLFAAFALLCAASQTIVVVYGVWLEDEFGLTTAVIGAVGFLFGAGDLAGNVASIRLTDRLGKVRSSVVGAAVLVVSALVLSLASTNIAVGIGSLATLLVGYEFALLSSKPLLTEVDPRQRGLGIGVGFGTAALFRAGAALLGTAVYASRGFASTAVLGGGLALGALVLLALTVREPSAHDAHETQQALVAGSQ
jgi:predicted MFS family arabinose efflux permease